MIKYGHEIDESLIDLLIERLIVVLGGEANSFLENLVFNLEDFLDEEGFLDEKGNIIKSLKAENEVLRNYLEDYRLKEEELENKNTKLRRENIDLCDEVDDYLDEIREYTKLLKALGNSDLIR